MNLVVLSGKLGEHCDLDHVNQQEPVFFSTLYVKRTSGTVDSLPLLIPAHVLESSEAMFGEYVRVSGEIRTHNIKIGDKKSLRVNVFVSDINIEETQTEDANLVDLYGTLCKKMDVRKTPGGKIICDFVVAVNRSYGKSSYIPCITWGEMTERLNEINIGDQIHIIGRFQSRIYKKDHQEKVVYEISVHTLEDTEE